MAKSKAAQWRTEDGLLLLSGWARDGLTNEQIADNIGIAAGTLYEWKNKYPDIDEALKKNKEIADRHVENALYKKAVGYRYTETTKERIGGKLVVTKEVGKEVAPDTTAIIYWLKNRKPDQWRDSRKEIKENTEIEDLTPLAEMIAHDTNPNH